MKLIGLIRLGDDAEIRYTSDGKPVAELRGAWNYGRKGDDGKRPTQWAKFALWGDRAESLSQYMTKGTALVVCVSDVHIESFKKRDGTDGYTLVGRVDDVEFAGGSRRQEGAAPAPAPAQGNSYAQARGRPAPPAPAPAPRPASTGSGFDDMDSDIPF